MRRSNGAHTETCSKGCAQRWRIAKAGALPGRNPKVRQASWRARNHRRRLAIALFCDVTPEYERRLRTKAKHCPLCTVEMTDEPYLPNSKELDHMIPINTGGTHTVGNVRIICRGCNGHRPHDGSDYTGPVTLWAQDA